MKPDWKNKFSLPLLSREMIQQSGRRSLYFTRTLLIVSMILWIWLAISPAVNTSNFNLNSMRQLGKGRELLHSLINVLYIGIYILVPILSCGSIAQEKRTILCPSCS
ncbi:MAG: hypothetical protein R3C11_26685 [Planctomycetaceae bacterium]